VRKNLMGLLFPFLLFPVVASAQEQPAVEPVAVEQSASEQPAVEPVAVEQSASEQPAAEPVALEQPANEQPANEQPASEEPPSEEPASEEPATEEADQVEKKWTTTITPVIWLANTSTKISVGDRSRSVRLSASDALSNFEAGGSGRLEINNGQWGGFADLFFISLGNEVNAGPRGNIPIEVGVDNFLWQVAGTYRLVNKEDFNLDLLAGARGYSLDVDIDIKLSRDRLE
jgi:hypothetical protein